ncbi:MAG TPA: DUF2306 domain-containing protein [Polyangiaceae bacterium]|nr:DUF2306 domain-containing protein [Polyangiaceae bacterium]
MPLVLRRLPARVFLAVMLAGSALITWYSLPYFDFGTLPPFVIEKLPVRFERLWLFSLRVHVAAAALSFPLCLLLLTRFLQRRPVLHRWLGRVAGVVVLFGLVPAGAVLAFDAKGGAVVAIGFLLSAAIVVSGMVYGIVTARRRDLVSHRRAMHHVVAQMSVAVVSRAMLVGFDFAGVDPDLAYVLALWVPVPLSALVVELRQPSFPRFFHELTLTIQRIRREISSSPRLARRPLVRLVARPGR